MEPRHIPSCQPKIKLLGLVMLLMARGSIRADGEVAADDEWTLSLWDGSMSDLEFDDYQASVLQGGLKWNF